MFFVCGLMASSFFMLGLQLLVVTFGHRHGSAGQHPGILNVSSPPWSIDNTGGTDVTHQLQAAIKAAYDSQLALFLPPGRFLVSDTLEADQDNYGSEMPVNIRPARWRTNVLIGSTAALLEVHLLREIIV